MKRRDFLQNAAALAVGGAIWPQRIRAVENVSANKPRRATLAQVVVHNSVEKNLATARRTLEQAAAKKGEYFLLKP
jgi:hypothetical protein